MPDREMRPQSESQGLSAGAHYTADDDIDLPPLSNTESGNSNGAEIPSATKANGGGFAALIGAAALLGAVLIGGWFVMSGGASESEHPNWQHVAMATDASSDDASTTVRVKDGIAEVSRNLEVSTMDVDRTTTRKVRAALRNGDVASAIQDAQGAGVKVADLASNPQLMASLQDGDQEFFEVYVFDCCDEDGDVIEFLVNGVLFATVPITHEGTSVSIPLQKGSNNIAMRGVRDGGGGVTVSLRSSRGDYFCRSMRVGQEYQMGVVAR